MEVDTTVLGSTPSLASGGFRSLANSPRLVSFTSILTTSARKVDRVPVFSNPVAWKQLISPNTAANERVDLMKSIFSDRDEVEVFEYLSGDDAQAFVDVIDEVSIRSLLPLTIGREISTETSAVG